MTEAVEFSEDEDSLYTPLPLDAPAEGDLAAQLAVAKGKLVDLRAMLFSRDHTNMAFYDKGVTHGRMLQNDETASRLERNAEKVDSDGTLHHLIVGRVLRAVAKQLREGVITKKEETG